MADIRAAFLELQQDVEPEMLPVIETAPPLLVLDLDGTMVYTTPAGACAGPPHFSVGGHETRLRPGLGDFLVAVVAHGYDLAIWTAASTNYAERMVDGIDKIAMPGFKAALKCVFTDEQTACRWERGRLIKTKELHSIASRCRVPLRRCLVVDDTEETFRLNVRNALPVPEWRGECDDDTLDRLQRFLCAQPCSDATSILDLSAWEFAPEGAGPLTKEATEGHRLGGHRGSMFIRGGMPTPAWSNRPPPATESEAEAIDPVAGSAEPDTDLGLSRDVSCE